MVADSNYLSDVNSFFRVWYELKQRFPANEAEFREALAEGPAAWQYRVGSAPTSEYRKSGKPVPYEIVVENDAVGPHLSNMPQRPGVIYYCVSQDLQEFWVTMTALEKDFSSAASIKRVGGQLTDKVWLIHAAGKDYPVKTEVSGVPLPSVLWVRFLNFCSTSIQFDEFQSGLMSRHPRPKMVLDK
jgi:hypothetical protein